MEQRTRSEGGLELYAPSKSMPGESLDVEVSLQPRREIKARQVRVELIGKEVVYQSGEGGTSRVVNKFTRLRNVLQGECILHKGIRQRWTTSIQVPDTAPPSCKGKITEVNWVMRAIVDIPWRRDLAQESPVEVLTTPLAHVDKGVADRTFRECALGLEFPKQILTGEEQIQGKLRLTVTHPFHVRGVRIELVLSERAGDRKKETVYLRQDVEGSTSFIPQEARSYDFSMASPPSRMVTMDTGQSSLSWLVRAILDRRMRRDFRVEGTVHVYNAP